MLLLLNSTAMAIIVHGVLLGAVLGLLYRMHVLAAHTAKIDLDTAETALFVREHLSSIEGHVIHLQAALKTRTHVGTVLEYL